MKTRNLYFKIGIIVLIFIYFFSLDAIYGKLEPYIIQLVDKYNLNILFITVMYYFIVMVPVLIIIYKNDIIKVKKIKLKHFLMYLLLLIIIGLIFNFLNYNIYHFQKPSFDETTIKISLINTIFLVFIIEFVYRFCYFEVNISMDIFNQKYLKLLIILSALLTSLSYLWVSGFNIFLQNFIVSLIISYNYYKYRNFIEIYMLHLLYSIIFGIIIFLVPQSF